MTNTRRARIDIDYMGKKISKELAPHLVNFKFNDNEGKSDDIEIELEDREGKWHGPWLPNEGDKIQVVIVLENWEEARTVSQLDCGTFFVDDVNLKGPPDAVTVKALSIPFKDGGKQTKFTRAWENATLPTILGDVARSAGLTLVYDAPVYTYERMDQTKETNLGFAKRIAKVEGLSVKVMKEQLIVYEQLKYEKKSEVREIVKGESDVLNYDFKNSTTEKYKKIEISYFDKKKKKYVKYAYDVPGVSTGPTLKVTKKARNIAEAKRWAQMEARNKNKTAKTGKITLLGDENLIQGVTVKVKKFGAFDGKYFIESTSHNVTGGYTVDVNLREVLSY